MTSEPFKIETKTPSLPSHHLWDSKNESAVQVCICPCHELDLCCEWLTTYVLGPQETCGACNSINPLHVQIGKVLDMN